MAGTGRRPRVLSCYSGAGGLDLGLHAAGYTTIGCLETDPDARATLSAAGHQWPVLDDGDVATAGSTLRPTSAGWTKYWPDSNRQGRASSAAGHQGLCGRS